MSSALAPTVSDAARRARAEGRFYDAIDAWRAALVRSPDDWRLALELKMDLKSALHYPDSDPQFRRAARHLPDAEWLAHYSALYAFHGTDLGALDARVRLLLTHTPGNATLHALRGDVARQRRDWVGAYDAFTQAARLDPVHPDYAAKRDAAERYQSLSRYLTQAIPGGPAFSVAVVNLDRNPERWEEIIRQFATCAPPICRVPGVEGSRLAEPAAFRLTGEANAPRGTLGCFLSHAAIWQSVVSEGTAHCLVVEDDAIPLVDLPARTGPLGLPGDYDVCFVNDRLEPRRTGHVPTAYPLADIMREFHPDDNAAGTDGYFVSLAGARKLLAWVAEDGLAADVDWRVVAYSLTPEEIARLPRHGEAWAMLDRLRPLVQRADRLRAYALHPALIRTVGVSSDREDQNRLAEGRR